MPIDLNSIERQLLQPVQLPQFQNDDQLKLARAALFSQALAPLQGKTPNFNPALNIASNAIQSREENRRKNFLLREQLKNQRLSSLIDVLGRRTGDKVANAQIEKLEAEIGFKREDLKIRKRDAESLIESRTKATKLAEKQFEITKEQNEFNRFISMAGLAAQASSTFSNINRNKILNEQTIAQTKLAQTQQTIAEESLRRSKLDGKNKQIYIKLLREGATDPNRTPEERRKDAKELFRAAAGQSLGNENAAEQGPSSYLNAALNTLASRDPSLLPAAAGKADIPPEVTEAVITLADDYQKNAHPSVILADWEIAQADIKLKKDSKNIVEGELTENAKTTLANKIIDILSEPKFKDIPVDQFNRVIKDKEEGLGIDIQLRTFEERQRKLAKLKFIPPVEVDIKSLIGSLGNTAGTVKIPSGLGIDKKEFRRLKDDFVFGR